MSSFRTVQRTSLLLSIAYLFGFFNDCLDLKTRCGERYDTRTKNIFVMNKDLLYEKGNKIVIRSS